MGKGVCTSHFKRWKQPENEYRNWYKNKLTHNFSLGEIQIIQVEERLFVGNMIAQKGIKKNSTPPIRYDALEKSLQKIVNFTSDEKATVHMPRIGCGLAGGEWSEVESIIKRTLLKNKIQVYVYDFEQ